MLIPSAGDVKLAERSGTITISTFLAATSGGYGTCWVSGAAADSLGVGAARNPLLVTGRPTVQRRRAPPRRSEARLDHRIGVAP